MLLCGRDKRRGLAPFWESASPATRPAPEIKYFRYFLGGRDITEPDKWSRWLAETRFGGDEKAFLYTAFYNVKGGSMNRP
jgi:hypothetical protein